MNPGWHVAETVWQPDQDPSLGPGWSLVVLLDRDDDQFFNGRGRLGTYSVRCGRRTSQLTARLADFIRYENHWHRQLLVAAEYPTDLRELVNHALTTTPSPELPRETDPEVIVHSTTAERWPAIEQAGQLVCAADLRAAGQHFPALAFETFGEPAEYAQFIHFSALGVPNGEVVVLSHQRQAIVTDLDASYEPGARLYFDARRLVRDRLHVRDGLHVLKVHRELPLAPYLLAAITPAQLVQEGREWTPRTFATAADRAFARRVG